MDDALFVRRHQTLRNLLGKVQGLTPWDRTIEQTLAQGLSFEQLGDDVRGAIVHADVINGDNIGMAESGGGAGFLLKTAQAVLIMGQRGFEYLDGDVPSQPFIAGAVNFAHPSRAYLF